MMPPYFWPKFERVTVVVLGLVATSFALCFLADCAAAGPVDLEAPVAATAQLPVSDGPPDLYVLSPAGHVAQLERDGWRARPLMRPPVPVDSLVAWEANYVVTLEGTAWRFDRGTWSYHGAPPWPALNEAQTAPDHGHDAGQTEVVVVTLAAIAVWATMRAIDR